eukprot:Gb_38072 [translate_table: standard]
MIIMRHYQPMAWAKWCRRLPRLIACMRRMYDFYMEINFQFESSVIPFLGRIAPSDTYRIWKCELNLRADMTLAGFDGLKIQRSDQSFYSWEKEATMGGSRQQVAQEDATMSETNVYRPGIDVTQAELVNQLNWKRQEKAEMVDELKMVFGCREERRSGDLTACRSKI